MAAIAAEQVKALRDKTGAGFGECKAALAEANGNLDDAVTILRKRGLAQAAKRVGRSTQQGQIGAYIHAGGKIGVLIEVNCESDFVANTDDFKNLMKELSMQVAAADPKYVSREDVPAEELEREKGIYRAQVEGKPANVIEKIVEGKLNSYFERFCLVDQPSIRDGSVKVSDLIAQVIAKLGENITVSRFTRYKLGEGA
ncbi:MAG: translation elongation factor Ts [Bacteroidales bacterium]